MEVAVGGEVVVVEVVNESYLIEMKVKVIEN